MSFTNIIAIDGNLVRDGDVKFLPSGVCALNFTVAHNSKRGDKEEVHYFDCAAFGKYAEILTPDISKGRSVLVIGKLQQRRWEKDGKKYSAVQIFATQVMFGQGAKKEAAAQSPPSDEDIPF